MNDFNELHALYHHGIKGQKWGVRRYQNEDGTLTEEGKKRFGELIQVKEDEENALSERNKHLENYRKYIKKKYNIDVYYQNPSDFRELLNREKESEFAKKYIEYNKKVIDLGDQYVKKYSEVEYSSHNFFTVIGKDRVDQILKNYKK